MALALDLQFVGAEGVESARLDALQPEEHVGWEDAVLRAVAEREGRVHAVFVCRRRLEHHDVRILRVDAG